MKKYIVLLTALLSALMSCSDKEESMIPVDEISVSTDTLRFDSNGGTLDLEVNSSGDWRMSGISDWIVPSVTSGTCGMKVSFVAVPNEGESVKESVFKFFVGAAVKKVVAMSLPDLKFQLASASEMTFSSEGGSDYVRLLTPMDELEYSLSGNGSEWIDMGAVSEAFGYKTRQIDVKENKLYVNRESVMTIMGEGKSLPVKITQHQRDTVGTSEPSLAYDLQSRDIEFKIRTNINADYKLADWMSLLSVTEGVVGADGLVENTFKVHLDESIASRSYEIEFYLDSKVMLSISVKQKNPNPIITNITDKFLRERLADMGWIYTEGDSSECEVLEPGLIGRTLLITSDGYSPLEAEIVDGLGAFPELEELTISNASVFDVNVSDCKRLKKISMSQVQYVENVQTGASPVSEVEIITESYGSSMASSIAYSGDNIKIIRMNSNSSMIGVWEQLTSVDVTGCPSLESLHAKRAYVDYYGGERCVLTDIYVTAAQKAAIDAGTLTVEKSDLTAIEVK